MRKRSPGYRFAVDEAGICPLYDLKAQVCSVHTNKDRDRERERGDQRDIKVRGRSLGRKERSRLLKTSTPRPLGDRWCRGNGKTWVTEERL